MSTNTAIPLGQRINASMPLRQLLIFCIKLAAIYIAWRLFSIFVGAEGQPIDTVVWPWLSTKWLVFNEHLKELLTTISLKLLVLMGYKAHMSGTSFLQVEGYGGVVVGNYCLAIELMVLFSALIISYPADTKAKLWFIPVGLVLIQVANVLRILALVMLRVYLPQYAEFNHHFTFRLLVFAFIVAMYYWFIKRYGKELIVGTVGDVQQP